MPRKRISVIIPSYNSRLTIKNCIVSVIETRYPDLEIIVVDDRSKDESVQIVMGLQEQYSGVVRFVRQEQNGGPARARNRGAREARGEYLFFLDSDTVMMPDALDHFAQKMMEVDAVTGVYDYQSINRNIAARYKALLNFYFFSRKGVIDYEVFDASRAGIKKVVFESMGGFNENLAWGMDYENEEFGYRLVKKYRNLLVPQVRVKHFYPGFRQLTKNYFSRVALWMEIFFTRRKFESGGVTSVGTAISSICLLLAIFCLLASVYSSLFLLFFLIFFGVYIYGYLGFLRFVQQKDSGFWPTALACNVYFTAIIASGAGWGALKSLLGLSKTAQTIKAEGDCEA